MKRTPFILSFSLTLFFSIAGKTQSVKSGAPAESFQALHWSIDDGLSQDETYSLLKDAYGFLWVGTRQGVNRFDGHLFKTYTENNGRNGISGNDCVSLVEDSLHNIWIGTNRGASRYNAKADTFTHFSAVTDSTHFKTVIPFCATRNDVFCVENGLFITSYNVRTLNKKVWVNMKGVAGVGPWNDSRSVYDSASNSVWLFAYGKDGLCQVSLSTGQMKLYEWPCVKPNPGPQIDPIHWKGAEDMVYDRKRNTIWINSLDGLIQFSLADKRFHSPEAMKDLVSLKEYDYWPGINIDRHGRIWFGTQPKGILIYDPDTRTVSTPFPDNPHLQKEVSDGTMRILYDRNDVVWIGYWLRKGFYQLNPFSQAVTRHQIDTTAEQALYSRDVFSCLYAGNGKMWIASAKGLCIYDTHTGTRQFAKENNFGIPAVIDTVAGKAWAGADVFQEIDVRTHRIRQVMIEDTDTPLLKYDMLQPFRNGILVQSTQENKMGVYFVSGADGKARRVLSFPLGQIEPGSLYTDQKRFIFLRQVKDNGVRSFAQKNGVWVRAEPPLDSIETKLFWHNKADDTYWVTTGKELIHYNKHYKLKRRYTAKDGLPSKTIMHILPDKQGNVWFHTDRSIHELDTRTGKITQMIESHGFQKQNFTFPRLPGIDDLGNLYFPAGWQYGQGFDIIQPNKLQKEFPPSSVYLQALAINQQPLIIPTGINDRLRLILKHFQSNITIETGVIDFFSKGKSSIRYKLEGINENWQYAPAYYTIRYGALPPGNYVLRIQAANAAGDYNGPIKSLYIFIASPFWHQWWFYALCALFVTAAVYLLFRYRMRQVLRTTKMRMAISSDLHDEVGATLTSISIFSEMAKQAVAPSSPAERYLQRIGERSRESIEKMSDIIWSVNPDHDNLQQLLLRMKTYVNEIFEAKDTAVHWQVPEAVEGVKLSMTQRKNFYLLFKEVVTNAAKYSDARNVFICLRIAGKTLSLHIKDDGAGFDKQRVRQGNGLKNIQQRAALLNGKVSLETCINEGTTIFLQFPA